MDRLDEMKYWVEKTLTHPDGTTENEREGIEMDPEEVERLILDREEEEE
ncbi:hypothetical protein [Nitrospina gracilis]|nr:hypothetical protein [Nitrospina gracilis]MCF8719811.1 hypothetical protein [Nitrospina gracilis Nb-211]